MWHCHYAHLMNSQRAELPTQLVWEVYNMTSKGLFLYERDEMYSLLKGLKNDTFDALF